MQTVIAWAVVDKKWPGLREAFLGFDPQRLLALSERQVEALLADPRIIRNRAKVNAVLHNANRMLELEQEYGTFRKYLRSKPDYWDRAKMLGKDFKFMGDMGAFHFLYVVKEQVPDYEEWRARVKPKRAPSPR
jgi:DNA-3-methyladenine glycosylase I